MEVSHVWRRASKFPKKFFANVAFKTNNCQKKVSRVFRIQKTIKTQNKKLITWLRSSVFLTQSHCRLPTATCRPRQPPVDAERWQRHSWGSSHPCVESGSSQSVNAKRNEEQKNNKWIKNDDMCNSLSKVPKLVTSTVVKPIFKLDSFIQGKSTRYVFRHSSNGGVLKPSPELLRHAPSHLIQFFILQHSSRTGTKRCSALQPIFCSTLPTEQVLRVFHEVNPLDLRTIRGATSETWEKHNMEKLDRSQKKFQKLVKQTCEEKITKWSQMLALLWKQLVQHFGSGCEGEQWMMLLLSEKKNKAKVEY